MSRGISNRFASLFDSLTDNVQAGKVFDKSPRNHPRETEDPGMETDWGPLEQFWKRWRGAALQVARRFVYPRDADDLLADAMFRLTRRYVRKGLDPNSLFPYLCEIIANLAIDKYRRKRVQECEYLPAIDLRTAEDQYRNGDEGEIDAILATVRPIYRAAMICVDVEEMSYEDTARFLGIARGTVRSRLHRGRAMARPAAEKIWGKEGRVRNPPEEPHGGTFQ